MWAEWEGMSHKSAAIMGFCSMFFVIFGRTLVCLEVSMGLPSDSFGHLFDVFLVWLHVDVNRLPVHLLLREVRGSKISKTVFKIVVQATS